MNELALFAGGGGSILAGKLLGWRTVCAVEIDAGARNILLARQRDGVIEQFPIWDDVRTFDGKPWRGKIDIITGGFPCQDISFANKKAKGIDGERSGLWSEMARIIGEVRPNFALIENSPALLNRGFERVLADLAAMGFDARWGVFSAAEIGAEHIRERVFILAYSDLSQCERGRLSIGAQAQNSNTRYSRWGKDKPGVDRVANGVANRLDRLKAAGNGWVPGVAARAFIELSKTK